MHINDFTPKSVPGLYSFYHYEASNGAWFQRSVNPHNKEITFCLSESSPFQRFPSITEFKAYLETI